MSGRAPEAVECLLNIALSSDTRLSDMPMEFSNGDSELALGESGRGSFRLLALDREVPKKKPLLEGLLPSTAFELLFEGSGFAVRKPAWHGQYFLWQELAACGDSKCLRQWNFWFIVGDCH